MNKLIFLIILIASITIVPAFAVEGQKLTVTTDNTAYQQGDIITVTGNIEKIIPGTPVIIQLFFDRTQVDIAQVNVSQNGKFSKTFVADGPLWNSDGIVIIRVAYGNINTEATFDYFQKRTQSEMISNFEVNIPDAGTFDIPYTMKGGILESISLNKNNFGLDIIINSHSDGYLTLQLDRDYIDSIKNDGTDEEFIILISNSENETSIQTEFRKIESNGDFRTIEIPLKNGDDTIHIIGTFVIPEFGTIAAIVLAVAIIAIIAVTSKSKLGINNF